MKLYLICLLGLSGCSSISETFDSTPGQGVGAKPITVVNHMVEHGQLKGSSLPNGSALPEELHPMNGSNPHLHNKPQPIGLGPIQRESEKTMRVWVAPYIDDQGYLHEASRVHTVIQPSTWQTNSSKGVEHVS